MKFRCKDCSKRFKCELCGKSFTKKRLTTHIEREHPLNKSNSVVLEKLNIDIVNNNGNNGTLLVAPSFSGKSYLMLKILSRIGDRYIYKTTKSPPEQHSKTKIKIKETGEEIKPLNEYANAIIVSDNILGSSNSKKSRSIFHKRKA